MLCERGPGPQGRAPTYGLLAHSLIVSNEPFSAPVARDAWGCTPDRRAFHGILTLAVVRQRTWGLCFDVGLRRAKQQPVGGVDIDPGVAVNAVQPPCSDVDRDQRPHRTVDEHAATGPSQDDGVGACGLR